MAGTDELIKATHASTVVNRGISEKFQDMSYEWNHNIIELKRRNEQITEIALTATRKYSPAAFDEHYQPGKIAGGRLGEDLLFFEAGTLSFAITGIGRTQMTTSSTAPNALLNMLIFTKSMHFLFSNAGPEIAQ